MKGKRIFLNLFLLMLLGLYGCNQVQQVLKSDDREYQYKRAIEWYDQGEYDKALQVMDEILPYYIARPEGEDLYYKFSYAHYYEKDYYLGGYYFRAFTRQYPYSELTEECHFMSAICLVKNAPEYYLDQTDTEQAIEELQLFLDTYPGTERRDTVNLLMDQLWGTLEKKRINGAILYYDMEQYRAAASALGYILEDFPQTQRKEELLYLKLESEFKYADLSVDVHKLERYKQAHKTYITFVSTFPESSPYMRRVNEIGRITDSRIDALTRVEENN